MKPKDRAALEQANHFVCILHDSYYGSPGEEALKLAIKLRKPVILFRPPGRTVAIPQEFEDYEGVKKLTTTAEETVKMIRLLTPSNVTGIAVHDYDWEKS